MNHLGCLGSYVKQQCWVSTTGLKNSDPNYSGSSQGLSLWDAENGAGGERVKDRHSTPNSGSPPML